VISVWRSLEKDFRDVPDTFGSLRADWSHQSQIPNHWRLAGGSTRRVRDRFEAVAVLAGKQLLATSGIQNLVSSEVLTQGDPLTRWLMAVREVTGDFEGGPTGVFRDDDGRDVGHLLTGSIPSVIEASALLCLKLAAQDPGENHVLAAERNRRSDGVLVKVFISWSGNLSHRIALQLRDWLPVVLPSVEPWVSSEDIHKGSRWAAELASELDATNCGLICVTPDNVDEPWLNFEAGALSKSVARALVHPFLVGLAPDDLKGPLAQFQATRFNKDDVRRLVKAINSSAEAGKLPNESVDRNLSTCWPDLERRLAPMLAEAAIPRATNATDRKPKLDIALADGLSEEETAMLCAVLTEDGEPVFPKDVAGSLNMHPERARHLLERLQGQGLLHPEQHPLYGISWCLSPRGRAILFDKGLL
jgi:hypothetical protein